MKKLVIFLVFIFSVVFISGGLQQKTYALSGSEFNADRIIDDRVFFNGYAMSSGEIQNFLNAKTPVCDTNGNGSYGGTTKASYGTSRGYPPPYTCLKSYQQSTFSIPADAYCNGFSAGDKSAAQIIYEVGVSCGVSQKAILVTLQKEQSLITDDWPWSLQYLKATGYGCPDTSLPSSVDANQNGCYDEFEGFFKQVYYGARQFKRYAQDAQIFTNYRPYRTSYIKFSPSNSCTGTNIYIQNQATSGLYIYTPYQPNGAALGNLYGTGDACSSYGNRNFWRMFNEWFGSTLRPPNSQGSPASSWDFGTIDTVAKGSDGALWQKSYDLYFGGWKSWSKIGGSINSDPIITTWGNRRLDSFSTNASGEVEHVWFGEGAWQQWDTLGKPSASVNVVGSPGAVSWSNGRVDIFARGSDDALWHKWYDSSVGGGWKPWENLGGVITASPTVSSWAKGRVDIFARGSDDALWHKWYDSSVGGGWKPWDTLGKP